uniref:G-protein coupled receptors family 1 profile domain-containing protein n=1 Tax=Neolamprologus brichardi TaxID=32507 RepID=A0A3Q4GIU4_NEOBR
LASHLFRWRESSGLLEKARLVTMCCTTSLLAFSSSCGDRLCFNRRLTWVGLSRPGNMAALTFDRHVSSVTIFLKNLAAADFLISLCLPLRIMKYANIKSEIIRKVYCNFGASAFYLNMYEVAADTVESIVHPLGNHMLQKVRGAKITSILTWVFLITVTSSYILVSLTTEKPGNETLTKVSCDEMHSKELNVLYKIIHVFSATIFVTVLVCLVFFYYKTSRKLSLLRSRSDPKLWANARRVAASVAAVALAYVFSFVPYHVVRTPYTLAQTKLITDCETKKRLFLGKESTLLLSVLHLCFDPLIFFYLNAPFRHTIRKLYLCAHPPVSHRGHTSNNANVRL